MNKFKQGIMLAFCIFIPNSLVADNLKIRLEPQISILHTIFLKPASPQNNKVFVRIRNSSGNTIFRDIEQSVKKNINSNYKVTENIKNADYVLQANIGFASIVQKEFVKEDLKNTKNFLSGMVSGGFAGKNIAPKDNQKDYVVAGMLLGGIMSLPTTIQENKNPYFMIKVDVEISVKNHVDLTYNERSAYKPDPYSSKSIVQKGIKDQFKYYRTSLMGYLPLNSKHREEQAKQLRESIVEALTNII